MPDTSRPTGPQFPTEESRRGLSDWVEFSPQSPVARLNREIATLRQAYSDLQEQLAEQRARSGTPAEATYELMSAMAELAREMAQQLRELRELRDALQHAQPQHSESNSRVRGSIIAAWRLWPGFRADMQKREAGVRRVAREQDRLPNITPETLSGLTRGDSPKSMKRRMADFGLNYPRDWPPSTWAEEEPATSPPVNLPGHAFLAAGVCGLILLDVLADGRLDGVANFSHLLGC